ncbi:NHL repeat-containing protein 2 [Cephus cinctus]|uniref:NHL repeat-containing protein 2 n=1 Tax=Cephus cinctus TaxID=211228 RepID=A0AAJ7BYI8_CEPCN|nr:NHL repeat-containing protein 2 [Cephus cinctus]
MCGQENKKMSVQNTVQNLTQACIEIRQTLDSVKDQQEREKIILKHIKAYADSNLSINDFQKGLEWFNVSEGLSFQKHLSGKLIVLDFFTYCCINCMHILPDLDALEKKYTVSNGLVVVGVHSAKFSNEKDSAKILSAVQRYNISHPVVNDAKHSMWNDIGIVCWPSLVLLGPKGQPLVVLIGEGHREELFLYVKVALAYFKSLNQLSGHSIPLKPAQHLLPASRSTLLFPGKVHAFYSSKGDEKLAVSDTGNNRILVMNSQGKVEHIIGGCSPGFKDGIFHIARFNAPQGVFGEDDIIYVADTENHAIRQIDLVRKCVSTLAGTGVQGHDYSGGKLGQDQPLSSPWDVVKYKSIIFIANAGTHQIWGYFLNDSTWWTKLYNSKTCASIVGKGKEENRNNCYAHAASLAQPSGLTIAEEFDELYFADSESSALRKVALSNGKVSAACGADRNPSNLHCFGDVDGKQYEVKLQHPLGVAWDKEKKIVWLADTYNHKIKKFDPSTGTCTTVYGCDKSTAFNEPSGLAVSLNGTQLYVADTNNHSIKSINFETGYIHTIPVELPKVKQTDADSTERFSSEINEAGGKLVITFDFEFTSGLKINTEAPQKWSIVLPDGWNAQKLIGDLNTPISVDVPNIYQKVEAQTLFITLDLVVCKTSECIPKKLVVNLQVKGKSDAPAKVFIVRKLKIF